LIDPPCANHGTHACLTDCTTPLPAGVRAIDGNYGPSAGGARPYAARQRMDLDGLSARLSWRVTSAPTLCWTASGTRGHGAIDDIFRPIAHAQAHWSAAPHAGQTAYPHNGSK